MIEVRARVRRAERVGIVALRSSNDRGRIGLEKVRICFKSREMSEVFNSRNTRTILPAWDGRWRLTARA